MRRATTYEEGSALWGGAYFLKDGQKFGLKRYVSHDGRTEGSGGWDGTYWHYIFAISLLSESPYF